MRQPTESPRVRPPAVVLRPSDFALLPPGPVLAAADWRAVEHRQRDSLREFAARYGPVFTVHAEGVPPRVYVADPDAVRDIFVLHTGDLQAQGTSLFRPLVGDESVVFLNGSRHRETRRLLGQVLHPRNPAERLHTMAAIVSGDASALPVDVGLPVQDFATDVTRRVIVTLLFGTMPRAWSTALLDALDAAMGCLRAAPAAAPDSSDGDPGGPAPGLAAARDALDRLLRRRLAVHRASRRGPGGTVLDHLLDARPPAGPLGDGEIVGHLKTLLVSGHETTSAALAWALCHLARRPDVAVRLRRELAELAASGGDVADCLSLPYLRAVCLETLRCSSPVPNGAARKVVNPFGVRHHRFPPGVEVVPAIGVAHGREAVFGRAELFDPQRFVGRCYRAEEFLPFGVGPRHCPGASLALQELAVALAVIVARDDLELDVPPDAFAGVSSGPTVRVPRTATIRRTTARPGAGTDPGRRERGR